MTPGVSSDTGMVEITYTPRDLKDFMSYKTDLDTMITVFEWSPSLPEHYGEYTVLIRLYDDDKDDPRSTLYVFGVAVEQVIDDEEQIAQV